jgi:membrane protein DedA with SNARE-associated domain
MHAFMAGLVDSLVRWIEPAYVTAGYVIVGAGVLMERSIFIGLIVPGDLILALGGVYASQGHMSLPLVIVIGTLAAIAGESTGFLLGRRFGARMIARIPLVRRVEPRLDQATAYFRRRGGWTVAIGRYATAAGAFIPFTAGVAGMPYRRFLLFDVPAVAVWAAGITIFGYVFGENLDFVDTALSRFGYIMLGLLACLLLGRWLWKRVRTRRR